MNKLRILAVADPAVQAYTDEKYGVLKKYGKEVDFSVVPWNEYFPKMMDAFNGKADYDIVMIAGHLWMYDFVKKGYLEELNYDAEDILPNVEKEMKVDGKQYLSPSFCDGHMIVYRKSKVRELIGKDLPEVITPKEFVEVAKTLSQKTGKPSIAMKADASEIFTDALPFLRMNGGDVYDEVGNPLCLDDGIVKGLSEYCSLKSVACEGTDSFGNEDIAAAIRNKSVIMATTWSGQLGVVYTDECQEKDDLGFATFTTAWNVTWSFALCKTSKNKEEAKKFLEYLRSAEVDKVTGIVSGCPVRMSNYKADEDKYPWYKTQVKMIENANTLPNILNVGDKNGVFYEEIAEAFAGKKSAQQAMTDAKNRIESI